MLSRFIPRRPQLKFEYFCRNRHLSDSTFGHLVAITRTADMSSRNGKASDANNFLTHEDSNAKTILTNKRPYQNCLTRIISLQAIGIPADKNTPDIALRQIYKDYIASSKASSADADQIDTNHSKLLQAAVISLTTGIAPPVAFPTETVYGLGADATNAASIAGIFAAKGRPSDNPLIVHISSIDHLERCLGGTDEHSAIPEVYRDLLQEFWPGPLTVLLPVPESGKGVKFAPNVHPGQNTIGFRMPSSPYARFLIAVTDRPIAAPSANSSGRPSPTIAQHVFDDMNGKINFILDGGSCDIGVESTVVDGLHDPPLILRPGGLSKGDLKRWGRKMNNVWQNVENGWELKKGKKRKRPDIEETEPKPKSSKVMNGLETVDVFESPAVRSPVSHADDQEEDTAAPRAPGMKYKHYAPIGRMFLFEPDPETGKNDFWKARQKIYQLLAEENLSESTGLRIAVLTTTSWPDHKMNIEDENECDLREQNDPDADGWANKPINLGRDSATIAQNLFAALRTCDDRGCNFIFAEAPGRQKLGNLSEADEDEFETVLERMRKAASVFV